MKGCGEYFSRRFSFETSATVDQDLGLGDYARSALEAFASEPRFTWLADRPADWRIRPADWPETRYEAKAAREGRVRYYFRFERV